MLRELESLTGQPAHRLLARVPFPPGRLEYALRLPRGWFSELGREGAGAMERQFREESERVGVYLSRYVVEALPLGSLPTVYLSEDEGPPLFSGDVGDRLVVTCPGCEENYTVGSAARFILLFAEEVAEEATESRGLVWYTGSPIHCPVAKFGARCAEKPAPWRPQPVRFVRGPP